MLVLFNNAENNGGTKRPFEKGKSGNPKGAPKKEKAFTTFFNEAVNKLEGKSGDKKIKGKAVVVQAYIDLGFNKQYPPAIRLRALDTILERIDGKALQNVNLAGELETNTPSVLDIIRADVSGNEILKKVIEESLKSE